MYFNMLHWPYNIDTNSRTSLTSSMPQLLCCEGVGGSNSMDLLATM